MTHNFAGMVITAVLCAIVLGSVLGYMIALLVRDLRPHRHGQ